MDMDIVTKGASVHGAAWRTIVKARRRIMQRSGQTMTEYALILPAVAIAAFASYDHIGDLVTTLLNNVIAIV